LPEQIVDTGAQNPGSVLSDMAIGNNSIFFADKQYGKIYSAIMMAKIKKSWPLV